MDDIGLGKRVVLISDGTGIGKRVVLVFGKRDRSGKSIDEIINAYFGK